ncbi:hypothetical protein ACA910_022146 [Epithemia clementina (nom. ined.)]
MIFTNISLLCVFCAQIWNGAAFSLYAPAKGLPTTALRSTWTQTEIGKAPGQLSSPQGNGNDGMEMIPANLPMIRLEGGKTIRTWTMPHDSERVEYVIKSNGRPINARIEMWLGPQRRTHGMDVYCEDGTTTPFRALFRFKKGSNTFSVRNIGKAEYPISAGVRVATPEWNKALAANTQAIWDANTPVHMQGDKAMRTFPIPANVKSVQILFWSANTGKKSTKARIEVLQAPNNKKQAYDLHCGGSSQPYHCILETPGEGSTLRIWNKNNLEFPFECIVAPYEKEDPTASPHLSPSFFQVG